MNNPGEVVPYYELAFRRTMHSIEAGASDISSAAKMDTLSDEQSLQSLSS